MVGYSGCRRFPPSALWPYRSRQCFLDRPATLQSVKQRLGAHITLAGPVCKALGFAVELNPMVVPRVSVLFHLRGPFTVVWLVVAMVVDPFNRVGWRRPWPHVGTEGRKRLPPADTDRDASASVREVPDVRRDITPTQYAPPDIIQRVAGVPMNRAAAPSTLATTALPQTASSHYRGDATIAPTYPVWLAAFPCAARSNLQNGPLAEPLAGKVYQLRAENSTIGRVHQKNLLHRFGRWKGPGGSSDLPLGPFHYRPSTQQLQYNLTLGA